MTKHFKVGALHQWRQSAAGEVLEYHVDEPKSITVEVMADGPVTLVADGTLVGFGEGMFTTQFAVMGPVAVQVICEEDTGVFLKHNQHDIRVRKHFDTVLTDIAPRRRQNDALSQITQLMRVNEFMRQRQYQDDMVLMEKRLERRLAKEQEREERREEKQDDKEQKRADKQAAKEAEKQAKEVEKDEEANEDET